MHHDQFLDIPSFSLLQPFQRSPVQYLVVFPVSIKSIPSELIATMLGALRRCGASIPRSLASTSARASISTSRSQVPRVLRLSAIRNQPATRSFSSSIQWRQEAYAAANEPMESDQGPKITRFQELADRQLIHPNVINAITAAGIETMTEVQSATINQALHGTDMLV